MQGRAEAAQRGETESEPAGFHVSPDGGTLADPREPEGRIEIRGDELGDEATPLPELRRRASDFAKENLWKRDVVNVHDGTTIQIAPTGLKKTIWGH